ncbi:MAG: hypothetical protein JJE30_12235 [Desulfuromonadales bacterium]|nr:hypothetical protein [Desulfuromonadales bacterium]
MNEEEIVKLIFSLRDDVWKNWGYIVTFNTALLGWLIQRHGLYSISEKIIASLGYSAFITLMLLGMNKSYCELDSAVNELAYYYSNSSLNAPKVAVQGGVIEEFIHKSPAYCSKLQSPSKTMKCTKYSDNYSFAVWGIIIGWLFCMALFWLEFIWKSIREKKANKT